MTPSQLESCNAALVELRYLHTQAGACEDATCCSTAKAIRDLEIAIGEDRVCQPIHLGDVRFDRRGNGTEATYPAMPIKDVVPAILEAQAGIGVARRLAVKLCKVCDCELDPNYPFAIHCPKCLP